MVTNTLTESVDDRIRSFGKRVVEGRPSLERLLLRGRDWYARSYVAARMAAYRVRYDAPIYPYRMIHVDPGGVEYSCEFPEPKFRNAGRVIGGDWDRTDARFEEYDVYRAYERHFEHGVPWEETEFFGRIVDELRDGREQWGCSTRAEFEHRCRRLDELYETIATNGYRTQDELAAADDTVDPIKPQAALKTERYKDEIAVHVGRDGDILFDDGRNRLSIVKLLDLDTVPVRVLRRHADWQAKRDAYVRGDPAVRHYADHPDIVTLEFDSGGSSLLG